MRVLRVVVILLVSGLAVFRIYGSQFNLRVACDVVYYAICIPGIEQPVRCWLLRRATKAYLAVNESQSAHQLELCARTFAVTPERDRDLIRESIVTALQSQTDEQIAAISLDAKRALAKLVEDQWFQKNISMAILQRWQLLASPELLSVVKSMAARQNTRHPLIAVATRCLPELEKLVSSQQEQQQLLRGVAAPEAPASLDHLRATESPGPEQDPCELLRPGNHQRT